MFSRKVYKVVKLNCFAFDYIYKFYFLLVGLLFQLDLPL